MALWNKYPYTDFHELNADWILQQISSFQTRLDTAEDDIDALESRMNTAEGNITNLQGRMTTAEGNITNLQGHMTTAEGNITNLQGRMTTAEGNITTLQASATNAANRLTALESADIQDAVILSDMTGVTADSDSVEISFTQNTFTNGTRTSTASDVATIPAATTSAAGVMIPEEKEKLTAYHLDNDDHATFSNPVAGPSPVGNNDFTTKAYVDNLAISGQAVPSTGTAIANADWTSSYVDVSDMSSMYLTYRSYGSLRSYYLNGRIRGNWSAVPYNERLLRGTVASAAIPAAAHDAFGCGQAAVSTGSDFTAVYPLNFRIAASGQVDIQIMAPGGIPAKSGNEDFMYVELQCVFIDV